MTYILWEEPDGLHSSFADGEQAEKILAMIKEDPEMSLIEVTQ